MALTKCAECAREISTAAAACPGCGAPNRPPTAAQPTGRPAPDSYKSGSATLWFGKIVLGVAGALVAIVFLSSLIGGTASKAGKSAYVSGQDLPYVEPPPAPVEPQYPDSSATYAEVDREVGCGSKLSDAKKADIFASKYENHWMLWSGKVALADSSTAAIDVDGGLQDLSVEFADQNAGYELQKDSRITIRFLMKSPGGCLLPFSGESATIERS